MVCFCWSTEITWHISLQQCKYPDQWVFCGGKVKVGETFEQWAHSRPECTETSTWLKELMTCFSQATISLPLDTLPLNGRISKCGLLGSCFWQGLLTRCGGLTATKQTTGQQEAVVWQGVPHTLVGPAMRWSNCLTVQAKDGWGAPDTHPAHVATAFPAPLGLTRSLSSSTRSRNCHRDVAGPLARPAKREGKHTNLGAGATAAAASKMAVHLAPFLSWAQSVPDLSKSV